MDTDRILKVYLDSINASTSKGIIYPEICNYSAEMALVRMYYVWELFCRNLVIISASGKAISATGKRIPRAPGIKSKNHVIPLLMSKFKKQKFEPRWGVSRDCIDAAQRLRVANFYEIAIAIGAANSPADDLRSIRNYFAHRSTYSASQVRLRPSLSGMKNLTILDFSAIYVNAGATILEEWVRELQLIAYASIQ